MQFHKYRKLHERFMISDISYMEIVLLAFSQKQKKMIFKKNLVSQNLYDLCVTEEK